MNVVFKTKILCKNNNFKQHAQQRYFTSKLTYEKLQSSLNSLPNWTFEKTENRTQIKRSLTFSNFKKAFEFMTRIADYAETVDHHPEWKNVYNKVDIVLSTHTSNAVTQKDIDLALRIEEISSSIITSKE